jgi:hypothetical protein
MESAMSRSFKHTPISGNTYCHSEKDDKRLANRAERRIVRNILDTASDLDNILLPIKREVSDVWGFGKDGRHWFGHLRTSPKRYRRGYAELMRK